MLALCCIIYLSIFVSFIHAHFWKIFFINIPKHSFPFSFYISHKTCTFYMLILFWLNRCCLSVYLYIILIACCIVYNGWIDGIQLHIIRLCSYYVSAHLKHTKSDDVMKDTWLNVWCWDASSLSELVDCVIAIGQGS